MPIPTRNAHLAAIHSLFRYAALRHPEHAALIQRVLAITPTRFDRTTDAAHMTVSALSGCLVPVSWLTMTSRIIISSTSREHSTVEEAIDALSDNA